MLKDVRKLGVYVHIPFCVHKCAYCDFYSITDTKVMREYKDALISHIRSKKREFKKAYVDTVFFGGGTPSILPPEYISEILEAIRYTFRVASDAEITLEANPGTLDSSKLAAYLRMGINRLSLGLQSADDEELAVMSRIHTRDEFETSYMLARMEGFQNINIDLIYALPGQSKAKLFDTINYVIAMKPEHISLYCLTIEDNTPFGRSEAIRSTIPDDEEQFDMYVSACTKLEERGYKQYEISNFAKKISDNEFLACKHNIKYWTNEEYIGFGPGAASFVNNTEYSYAPDVSLYMSCLKDEKGIRTSDDTTYETESVLDAEDLEFRFLMTGFRLRAGISIEEYNKRFPNDFEKRYGAKIEKYIKSKDMVKTDFGYRLTRKGIMRSNMILTDVLIFKEEKNSGVEKFSSTNEVTVKK